MRVVYSLTRWRLVTLVAVALFVVTVRFAQPSVVVLRCRYKSFDILQTEVARLPVGVDNRWITVMDHVYGYMCETPIAKPRRQGATQ